MWTPIAFFIIIVALILQDSRILKLEQQHKSRSSVMADLEQRFSEYKRAHMIDWTPEDKHRIVKGPRYKDPTVIRKDSK